VSWELFTYPDAAVYIQQEEIRYQPCINILCNSIARKILKISRKGLLDVSQYI
jgi:hypothetical protein